MIRNVFFAVLSVVLVLLFGAGCTEQVAGVDGGTNGGTYYQPLPIDRLLYSDYLVLGRPMEVRRVLFDELATTEKPSDTFFRCSIFSVATIDTLNAIVNQGSGEVATPPWSGELATYHDECMQIPGFGARTRNLLAYPTALFFAQNNVYLNRPYVREVLEVVDSKVRVGPSNTRCGVALEIDVNALFNAVAANDYSTILEADTLPCQQNDGATTDNPDGSDGSGGK